MDHPNAQKAAIKLVAVSPFDEINKYIFLLDYRKHGDAHKALTTYSGNDFDIMLIAENVSDKLFIRYKILADYLEENNIPFGE